MRTCRIQVLSSVMTAIFLSSCDFISMEQVPSSEAIRGWMGRFLVSPDQVQGVYRNLDVDSLVFTYTSAAEGESAFWSTLEQNLHGSRWNESDRQGTLREYRRSYRKNEHDVERPDMAIFSSFEVVRIVFDSKSRRAVVAYVQADGSSNDTKFEETGEGKWADKAIWPRFRDLVSKLNTDQDSAAHGSLPIRSETNRTSGPAGSRR